MLKKIGLSIQPIITPNYCPVSGDEKACILHWAPGPLAFDIYGQHYQKAHHQESQCTKYGPVALQLQVTN